eukprot:4019442-Pyramimonas_sp.AAC.1
MQPAKGLPSLTFLVLVEDVSDNVALLGFLADAFDPGDIPREHYSFLSELFAAQWAMTWVLQ